MGHYSLWYWYGIRSCTLVLLLLFKLWPPYSAFSFKTHIIFKDVAVCAVMPCSLVDRYQRFQRICCLHLHVITMPPQDYNLINHHDKVKCFVPLLSASGAWLPVLPQRWLPILVLPRPSIRTASGWGCWQNINCQLDHSNTNCFLCLCMNWQYCTQKHNNVHIYIYF